MSGKQVSGSLSSRVMNMKFMRFSSDKNSSDDNTSGNTAPSSKESTVDSTRSFHDNSEWSLDDASAKVKKNTKTIRLNIKRKTPIIARQVNSSILGVTMLQRGQVSVRGKTLFGGEPVVPITEETNPKKRYLEESEENDGKESKNDDGYDLDKIFKDTMKKKSGSNENNAQNKKSKKNKKTKKQRKN